MHLDEGTIHAWLDGALDPEEASRVEQHTSECAACAAAVAEARGLVAGASRILGALDHTPGGVVPGGMRHSSGSARPPRSLWRVLHFTPVRAAAAALFIVAAGTVLVARHAPNGALPLGGDETGPEELQPRRAASRLMVDTTASAQTMRASAAESGAAAPDTTVKVHQPSERPVRKMAAPVPAPSIAQGAKAAVGHRDAIAEQERAVVSSDSIARRASNVAVAPAAPVAPSPSVVGGAARARARVAGGVAGAVAAAPTAEVEQRSPAAALPNQAVGGCYAVEADAVAGLPRRLVLDSSAVGRDALLDSRRADSSAARSVLKMADVVAPASVSWQAIGGNGIRLSVAGSAASPMELHFVSPTTLMGTKTIGDRRVTITLRRTADCPTR